MPQVLAGRWREACDVANQQTPIQIKSKQGIEYRARLINRMVQAVGSKASDAITLSQDDELQRYMRPTSPAAEIALENGGTLADAHAANTMYAQQLKAEQQQMTAQMQQQRLSADDQFKQLQQAGLTDEAIFATCRKYADELAKTQSMADPAKEAAYHEKMTQKAAEWKARQPTITTLGGSSNASELPVQF